MEVGSLNVQKSHTRWSGRASLHLVHSFLWRHELGEMDGEKQHKISVMSQATAVHRSHCDHKFFFLSLSKCSFSCKPVHKAGNTATQNNLKVQNQALFRGIHTQVVQVDTNYQDEFFTWFAWFCLPSSGNEVGPPCSALIFLFFFF